MDFTKIDFSKFDVTKMFDVTAALDSIESTSRTALGYIPDAKSRGIAQDVMTAYMKFVRAQTEAMHEFAMAVKSAVQSK